jgi:uncharacterized membrane protein YraQ (UPF0718 family)
MTEAILLAVLSVAAGTVLALFPGKRDKLLGPIRTFGLTASLGVVFLHLLPEALAAIGGWALAALLAGLVAPELLGRLGVMVWQMGRGKSAQSELALEAGYVGLLIHHVGDGIGLGAYTGEMHAGDSHGGVVTALAAHAVPVVAIMVLAFDSVRGRGSAIVRAIGLGIASVTGVLLANAVPPDFVATSGAWVTALVSGLLVHVVTHDLTSQGPRSVPERSVDLLVAAAGIAVSLVGGVEHGAHHAADPRDAVAEAFLHIAIETGPILLLGLTAGALIQAFGKGIPRASLRSRGVVTNALRGALVGAPLPLCSRNALPISDALNQCGAAPAFVVAFLLATPELGIETFALSAHFFGWRFAWVRLVGAVLLAVAVAVVVGSLVRDAQGAAAPSAPTSDLLEVSSSRAHLKSFVRAFDELLHHVGAWMLVGVIAAAFLQASLPAEALASWRSPWLELFIVSVVAVPSYVCAPAATPLAAVLIAKGLSPGAALVGLLLGPATNVATLAFVRRWYGWKGLLGAVVTLVGVSWSLAFAVNRLMPVPQLEAVSGTAHEASPVWLVLAVVSGVVLLRSVWLSGTRAWLSSLQGAGGGHDHSHGHAQSHGHAH